MDGKRTIPGYIRDVSVSLAGAALYPLLNFKNFGTLKAIPISVWVMCALSFVSILMTLLYGKNLLYLRRNTVRFIPRKNGITFFNEIMGMAKKSIFFIGPNLTFLIQNNHKDCIFSALLQKGLDIRLLLTSNNSPICPIMRDYAFTPTFIDELNKTITAFTAWQKEVKNVSTMKLQIKTTDAVILSLVFIDAEEDDGKLFITPIPWKINGGMRPTFLIEKKLQNESFDRYYDTYDSLFGISTAV